MRPVFRFAPSPNGYLHLGHAKSALLNSQIAKRVGGDFLLRIEDIDASRCRPEFEAAIYEDLAWLGISWSQPVRRQSEHMGEYRAAIERLVQAQLAYRSFETRADIARMVAQSASPHAWPRDPDGAPLFLRRNSLDVADEAKSADAGVSFAWRLNMAEALSRAGPLTWTECGDRPGLPTLRIEARPDAWGDVVIARKDVPTSYHLSVVLDDALQGVTDVVRGADLYDATSVHRLLQTLLGLPEPRYIHHALVLDAEGRKLSKSSDATSLRALRGQGVTPADIRRMLGCPG